MHSDCRKHLLADLLYPSERQEHCLGAKNRYGIFIHSLACRPGFFVLLCHFFSRAKNTLLFPPFFLAFHAFLKSSLNILTFLHPFPFSSFIILSSLRCSSARSLCSCFPSTSQTKTTTVMCRWWSYGWLWSSSWRFLLSSPFRGRFTTMKTWIVNVQHASDAQLFSLSLRLLCL